MDVGKAEHAHSASDSDAEFTQTSNSKHAQVKVDSREGGIWRRRVGDTSMGITGCQNGDLRGNKGAKVRDNTPQITKPTRTRPSVHHNSSQSTSRARTKQPITSKYFPHRLNHSNSSKLSISSDEGPKMELGENSPEDHSDSMREACMTQPMTTVRE